MKFLLRLEMTKYTQHFTS